MNSTVTRMSAFARPTHTPSQRRPSQRAPSQRIHCAHGQRQSIRPVPRILCIDDDPEFCRSLELRLRSYEADVVLAYYGTQGFCEATTEHPDIILMDISMPSGDGRFVMESLRNDRRTRNVPVIVVTGNREDHVRQEMTALGADRFLNKPIRFQSLVNEISQFITLTPRSSEHHD